MVKMGKWSDIVAESKDTLQGVDFLNDQFVLNYLNDASSKIKIVDMKGQAVREVQLPGIGSAGGFGGRRKDSETFYTFSSFNAPPTIYRYDMKTGKSTEFRRAGVKFDGSQYEVKQVFYTSKDGTRVPMFLTYKKGLKLDGSNPTLLYGYGGFNISMTPGFSVSRVPWLEMGGVYAVANIRGGAEYGQSWWKGGSLHNKQNVFDDFIGAAEWLIANKYTSTPKLAIQGGSNGGLLIGAVLNQRPDLFGAALPAVGVMDMVRFPKFTIGWAWTSDYGSPDNKADFDALYKYSPLHNVKAGAKYPATLVTTSDHDDRVFPAHSFKYTAALQAAQAGEAPVLIRIETKAGHGAGKPTSKQIEEQVDIYGFLIRNLGIKLEP
jgi:prolyl oligopeptidase